MQVVVDLYSCIKCIFYRLKSTFYMIQGPSRNSWLLFLFSWKKRFQALNTRHHFGTRYDVKSRFSATTTSIISPIFHGIQGLIALPQQNHTSVFLADPVHACLNVKSKKPRKIFSFLFLEIFDVQCG